MGFYVPSPRQIASNGGNSDKPLRLSWDSEKAICAAAIAGATTVVAAGVTYAVTMKSIAVAATAAAAAKTIFIVSVTVIAPVTAVAAAAAVIYCTA